MKFNFSLLGAALLGAAGLQAADTVYSGPQPGEKTTPFKTWAVTGNSEGKERDPVAENAGAPTALVFIHTVERSLLPLLRAVDQYGFERKDLLKTEVIFLYGDRLEGEQRVKTVTRSLQLHSQSSLSLDGAEGPGNYGLNKECMMTIIAAKDNKVTASFALVQPGIADAPRVLEALAKTCGDTNPPPIERLTAGGTGRVAPDRAMQRDGAAARRGATNQATAKAAEPFPGAVPTDPTLNSLLRQFIRPTNDVATVDKLLSDAQNHVKNDPALQQQAIDGWTRVLHFGDHYGTPYARKVGQEWLNKLKETKGK